MGQQPTFDDGELQVSDTTSVKPGYVLDYITGRPVKATPEETEAVQVFAQRLVEDYGYSKEQVQTHPQYRVRKRPSDEEKSYPVDIAVFKTTRVHEDDLFIVVECKKKNRRDGIAQLKLYLDMSPAEIGVWFNGDEHVYLHKVYHRDGSRTYEELPNIPRLGQRLEDIGLFKRRDLKKPSNLKAVFRDVRNHLAGMTTGITRDEALAQEIINLLFCKILDEQDTAPDDIVNFRAGIGESPQAVKARILILFDKVKTAVFDDVFDPNDTINLDPDSLHYVVGELQNYAITEADRDAVGDAFEVFIGPALRGPEGQFFTPRNVVKMMINILDPKPGENIIDPACGSGGFLIAALEHTWEHLRKESQLKGWNDRQLLRREIEVATAHFRGNDKDAFLAKVCKAYMALVGDGRGGIFCANSLVAPSDWPAIMQDKIRLGKFDVVLTNPPFGKKIVVKGSSIMAQYKLGHKWKRNTETGEISPTAGLHEDQPPQILFLERCLQLLKVGGRLGIILPESIFGMPSYEYVIAFLRAQTKIRGIVAMPEPLFKTSGKGGTHAKVCVLFLENTPPEPDEDYEIFMADVKWCGHDSRGNPTYRDQGDGTLVLLDDIPTVTQRFVDRQTPRHQQSSLGFTIRLSQIKNGIFIPKYYNPEIRAKLDKLSTTHHLIVFGDLVQAGHILLGTGNEIGKMAYGTGPIPFIRTSDISNWEIKTDPKQGVSKDIYERYVKRQDVQVGDIFFVRDGTYLIGQTGMVTQYDLPCLYQSHILKIRVSPTCPVDRYLLLAALNAQVVKQQIRARQFTADIIDTIGNRLLEVVFPIPRDEALKIKIIEETRELIETRAKLRNRAREIALKIDGSVTGEENSSET
jgi:type I restriction enzyme M protein